VTWGKIVKHEAANVCWMRSSLLSLDDVTGTHIRVDNNL